MPTPLGAPYTILDVKGRGHYVGTVLSVVQNQPGWFGEGDDFFYVDGNRDAVIQGTGTEDYFNDAWSLRVATGPYAGVAVADGTGLGSRMSAYRWHLADPVPFTTALRFDIEHKGWTYNDDGSVRSGFEEREDLLSSVAFWYQDGIAADLPEPPYGSARLPHSNAMQIEVEQRAAEAVARGGTIAVDKEVFWSKDILRFNADGSGLERHRALRRAAGRQIRAGGAAGAQPRLRHLPRAARRPAAGGPGARARARCDGATRRAD